MRAAFSDPVSRLGFISLYSTVWAPHICQKTLRENQPACQTNRQLDRKRSSKGLRGCLGWFMPCSGMLNEFRVHCCYGNWLNGYCSLSQWCLRILWVVIVKMWRYYPILVSLGTSNTSRGRQRRKWITIGPKSEFLVTALTASAKVQSWATCWRLVAKQKWKTLICIISPHNHSKQKFLRVTSTSDMTPSVCASLRGLCASVAMFQKSQTSGSHSHFMAALSLLICLSYSQCCLSGPSK